MTPKDFEEYEETIHLYLTDALDGVAKADFEDLLAKNKDLQKEVIFRKRIKFVHKYNEEIAFDDTMIQIIEENKSKREEPEEDSEEDRTTDNSNFKGSQNLFKGIMGLGIAAILFWLAYTMLTKEQKTPEEIKTLIEQYAEPFENTLNINREYISPLTLGIEAYEGARYDEAIGYFDEVVKATNDVNAKFYLAVSCFFADENEKALLYFESLKEAALSGVATEYSAASNWYLALIYLKKNNTAKAEKLLTDLLSEELYQVKAKKLLEDLE